MGACGVRRWGTRGNTNVSTWKMFSVTSPFTKRSATFWRWTKQIIKKRFIYSGWMALSKIKCHQIDFYLTQGYLVDKVFTMDESGAPSLSNLAGLPRWPEFHIFQLFARCFSTSHSRCVSICATRVCSRGLVASQSVWGSLPNVFSEDR